MPHSFFLKYADYSTGMRIIIDGFKFHFNHNVLPEPEDEIFGAGGKSVSRHFFKRLKQLYPEPWGEGLSHGEICFGHVFLELFAQVERYKRKYPTAQKSRRKKSARK